MKALAAWLMGKRWTAVFAATVLGVLGLKLPPFAIFSGAVVSLVALRRGIGAGLTVVALAALPIGAAWVWLDSRPGLVFPLAFALWPPLLLASAVLRRSESQGLALLVIGFTVMAYALIMHLFTGDVVGFWQEWLQRAVRAVPGADLRGFEEEGTLRLLNGFLGYLYGLSLMLALLFARWLQSLLYHPGGFAVEFHRLQLPRPVLPLLIAAIWLSGRFNLILASDWFIAAMLIYSWNGLAVIHGLVTIRRSSLGWVVPVYLALIYLPAMAVPGLALLGAVDTLVDFRNQNPRGGTGPEP